MSRNLTVRFDTGRELAVTAILWAALGALAIPLGQAQEPNATTPAPFLRHQRLFEQTRPQKEVPFNPRDFDKSAGYYRQASGAPLFFHIYRRSNDYYSQITGQLPVQIYPEGPSEFFATVAAAQLVFDTAPDNHVAGLVLHQGGLLIPWDRVSKASFKAANKNLQRRIKKNIPDVTTEVALRHQIEALESGEPDYHSMSPGLAQATRQQLPQIRRQLQQLGALETLKFRKVQPNGSDVYLAAFEHGQMLCSITPLSTDGTINGEFFHRLPRSTGNEGVPGADEGRTDQDGGRNAGGNSDAIRLLVELRQGLDAAQSLQTDSKPVPPEGSLSGLIGAGRSEVERELGAPSYCRSSESWSDTGSTCVTQSSSLWEYRWGPAAPSVDSAGPGTVVVTAGGPWLLVITFSSGKVSAARWVDER